LLPVVCIVLDLVCGHLVCGKSFGSFACAGRRQLRQSNLAVTSTCHYVAVTSVRQKLRLKCNNSPRHSVKHSDAQNTTVVSVIVYTTNHMSTTKQKQPINYRRNQKI